MANIRIDWELTLEYWAVVAVVVIMRQAWLPDCSVWDTAQLVIGQPGVFMLLVGMRSNYGR